jgi:hypothetical protein
MDYPGGENKRGVRWICSNIGDWGKEEKKGGDTYAYVNPTAFVKLNTSARMTIGRNLFRSPARTKGWGVKKAP